MVGYGANKGIVPMFCDEIFKGIEEKRKTAGKDEDYTVSSKKFITHIILASFFVGQFNFTSYVPLFFLFFSKNSGPHPELFKDAGFWQICSFYAGLFIKQLKRSFK